MGTPSQGSEVAPAAVRIPVSNIARAVSFPTGYAAAPVKKRG
jgi:hypothetical protein